jgi:DNA polymerase III delta subunit
VTWQNKIPGAPNYDDYIAEMRSLFAAKSSQVFPRIICIVGPSDYLHKKTLDSIKKFWLQNQFGEAHSIECGEIEQRDFQSICMQSSLFETTTLYILRRASGLKALGAWLSTVTEVRALKSWLVIDAGEKLSVDVQKQMKRLGAKILNCCEPQSFGGYVKIVSSLAARHRINLSSEALNLIVESTGLDLMKIENEVLKLSLQFSDVNRQLVKEDIAPALGNIRDEDIFELFKLLRDKKTAKVHLLTENFLNRGESAIAINGIFSRYSREQVERGVRTRGIAGLAACIEADRKLKSSGIDESLILSQIIEALAGA